MKQMIRDLERWFFAPSDARTAAGLRIGFCLLYALMLLDLYPVLHTLFGRGGLYGTLEPFPFALDGFRYLLFRMDSALALQVWFWGSLAVALCGVFGVLPRVSVWLTYASLFLFRERGPFITFGADLVLNCIGVWLLFLDTGRAWTWPCRSDRLRRREVEGWPVRAIAIQVALVYLVTGLAKLQTQPWQDGSAVYYALQVGGVTKGAPPAFIMHTRWLLVLMTYGTLLIELSVPFALLCYRPLRYYAIGACFALHTGIDLLMSIRFFSLAMYVGLWSFVDRDVLDRCVSLLERCRQRSCRVGHGGAERTQLHP